MFNVLINLYARSLVDMMPGHVCDLHTEDCLDGNRDSIGLAT